MYREIKHEELKIAKDTGYVYFVDYNHPLATGNSGRVYYHRHIASVKESRWLTSIEQVHHIDENKINNNPDNLSILTAKEHARIHSTSYLLDKKCPGCSKMFKPKCSVQVYCTQECHKSNTSISNLPPKKELEILLWTIPYTLLAKKFNCSDSGLKKAATRLGCLLPPSRFHSKMLTESQRLDMYKAALAQLVEH